jgi:hypothetical protein
MNLRKFDRGAENKWLKLRALTLLIMRDLRIYIYTI